MNKDKLLADLKREEGKKVSNGLHYVYRDSKSYLTLGYGCLVDRAAGGGTGARRSGGPPGGT